MIIMKIFRKFEKIFYLSSGYPSLPHNCLFNKSLPQKGHFFSVAPKKPSLEQKSVTSTCQGFHKRRIWGAEKEWPLCGSDGCVELMVTAVKHQSPLLRLTEKKLHLEVRFFDQDRYEIKVHLLIKIADGLRAVIAPNCSFSCFKEIKIIYLILCLMVSCKL